MSNAINNFEDIIDSRDIIKRIEELDDERADLVAAIEEAESDGLSLRKVREDLAEWDQENASELNSLKALADEAEGYAPDWHHGETLIRYSYFKEYAMELADDIGAVPANLAWPLNCIDWDQAARELQMDYTAVEFDGVTYYIR